MEFCWSTAVGTLQKRRGDLPVGPTPPTLCDARRAFSDLRSLEQNRNWNVLTSTAEESSSEEDSSDEEEPKKVAKPPAKGL